MLIKSLQNTLKSLESSNKMFLGSKNLAENFLFINSYCPSLPQPIKTWLQPLYLIYKITKCGSIKQVAKLA